LYNGQVFTQPENAGVVRLGQADDYIGVILELKAAECFLQVSRTQFSSSAGKAGTLRQPFGFGHWLHPLSRAA
jgi:hypothetical protein